MAKKQISIHTHSDFLELEDAVNEEIKEFEEQGKKIVDIKFSTSRIDKIEDNENRQVEYSAMIIIE